MKTSDGVIMAYVNEFGGLGGYREYSLTMNFYVRQRLCYKLTIKTLRERLFCSLRVFCCNKILITFIFYSNTILNYSYLQLLAKLCFLL